MQYNQSSFFRNDKKILNAGVLPYQEKKFSTGVSGAWEDSRGNKPGGPLLV
jgi:hypothetical protein